MVGARSPQLAYTIGRAAEEDGRVQEAVAYQASQQLPGSGEAAGQEAEIRCFEGFCRFGIGLRGGWGCRAWWCRDLRPRCRGLC